jgi:hypothetical protein
MPNCRKGKPCGKTCIRRSKRCYKEVVPNALPSCVRGKRCGRTCIPTRKRCRVHRSDINSPSQNSAEEESYVYSSPSEDEFSEADYDSEEINWKFSKTGRKLRDGSLLRAGLVYKGEGGDEYKIDEDDGVEDDLDGYVYEKDSDDELSDWVDDRSIDSEEVGGLSDDISGEENQEVQEMQSPVEPDDGGDVLFEVETDERNIEHVIEQLDKRMKDFDNSVNAILEGDEDEEWFDVEQGGDHNFFDANQYEFEVDLQDGLRRL